MDQTPTPAIPPVEVLPLAPHRPLWPALGWRKHLIAIAILLGLVSLTYSNSYQSGMTLDNRYIIEEYYKTCLQNNPRLDIESWEQIKLLFSYDYWWPKGISGLYRPITSLSYWFDYVVLTGKAPKLDDNDQPARDAQGQVIPNDAWERMSWQDYTKAPGRLNTNSYHTINLILHWVNAMLAYFIALALIQQFWPAFFTAALFATHPIATESVTNIIGRADMFAAFSIFGGLLLYMRSTRSVGAARWPWLIGLMLICMFGFLCKESSAAIGLIVPAYWLIFEFEWKKPDWLWQVFIEGLHWAAAMLPPLIAMFLIRAWVFGHSTPAEEPFLDNPIRGIWQVQSLNLPSFASELARCPLLGVSFIECKMTAVKIMGRLLVLLAWPWTLCCDYSYSQIPNFSWTFKQGWDDWQAVISLFALLGIAAGTVWLYIKQQRAACFFIVFFFLAALPTSNFIITIGSVMAERFMYLPLAGFTGIFALGAFTLGSKIWDRLKFTGRSDIPGYSILVSEILGLVVLIYGVRAYFRNYVWQDDVTLWEDAIVHSPKSFRCYQSLAFALYERDQSLDTLNKLIDIDAKALPIVETLPNHLNSSRLYLHLGMYFLQRGDLLCQHMPNGDTVIPPAAQQSYANSILVLEKGAAVDRAFDEVNRAKQLLRGDKPETITNVGLAPIYGTLGMAYARITRWKEAYDRLQYQRHLDPNDSDSYIKLALLHSEMHHPTEAAYTFIEAILIDQNPRRADYWNMLIQHYASMGDAGKNAIVVENGEPRLNILDPSSPAREHLAYAYRDFIRIFRRARMFSRAEAARQDAITKYGYPAAMFDPLFQEPIEIVTPQGMFPPPGSPAPAAQ